MTDLAVVDNHIDPVAQQNEILLQQIEDMKAKFNSAQVKAQIKLAALDRVVRLYERSNIKPTAGELITYSEALYAYINIQPED